MSNAVLSEGLVAEYQAQRAEQERRAVLYPAANRQGVLEHELCLLRRERTAARLPHRRTAWLGEQLIHLGGWLRGGPVPVARPQV